MPSGIKQAFNQAAHTYNEAASVQHVVGEHLIQCLPDRSYHRVFDLGCGTGHTTNRLANQLDFDVFVALDIAPLALTIARETCKNQRISFIEGDFNNNIITKKNDLIFSNMALHWADDLNTLLRRCHFALNKNGLLAFSLPLSQTFHELNHVAARRALPTFTEVVSLLKESFMILHHENKQYQTTHENTLACLRAIKQTGATFAGRATQKILTKQSLREHCITQLTYDIGYFILEKK